MTTARAGAASRRSARARPPGSSCPDLSATTYGGRVALAQMAAALGKSAESMRWQQQAQQLRSLILQHLYSPTEAAFYDVDAAGEFVRIRCDILSRVCGEHVVDQPIFE